MKRLYAAILLIVLVIGATACAAADTGALLKKPKILGIGIGDTRQMVLQIADSRMWKQTHEGAFAVDVARTLASTCDPNPGGIFSRFVSHVDVVYRHDTVVSVRARTIYSATLTTADEWIQSAIDGLSACFARVTLRSDAESLDESRIQIMENGDFTLSGFEPLAIGQGEGTRMEVRVGRLQGSGMGKGGFTVVCSLDGY